MQYFGASLLTLLGLANSLQCTEVNGGHNTWSSRPRVRLEIHPLIEEGPHSVPGKKLVLHKKNEPLNMTCTVVYQNGERDDDTSFDYTVDWKVPRHVNNNPKIERGQSRNTAWISFERLAEKDAGDYTCMAVSQKPFGHQTSLSVFFYLFVEHKPTYCGPQWFRCRLKNCIMKRYVCDGKQDCEEGEDESPAAGCGLDPCLGKVWCEDRCIPPEWCCDHRNCSGTFELRPWPHENHEISYVQTAFYTVIGCAMAFMFIVTILVIAICRVQIKRAMNSRCSQQNRNVICGRRALPLYDLDVYLNRTADVNYPGGVSIMYNINSGVQFVGRPAEPPPYSEVIAEPPREGPPPPYVSCENLIVRVSNPCFNDNTETTTCVETVSSTLPLNRNRTEMSEDNDSPDMDIRSNATVNQCENTMPNVPGPQVPTNSNPTEVRTIVTRDSINRARIIDNLESRDSVDASANTTDSARIQTSVNYDLEYVETDALLADNTTSTATNQRPKDSSTWKPYGRHALMKSRWLNNERRDRSIDKKWYRQRHDKTTKDCEIRESSCHKDSANEGVFLDTDQQDLTTAESTSNFTNERSADFTTFTDRVVDATTIKRRSNADNVGESVSSNSPVGETVDGITGNVTNDRRDSETIERRDKLETSGVTRKRRREIKFLLDDKSTNGNERNVVKKSTTRHFLRGIKRQTSLNDGDTATKNLSESSACASTGSVELPNPRLDDDDDDDDEDEEANSLLRQSSLVLPLRESFIGVQRDS